MSTILVDSISDTAGTGSPSFPNGISGNGSALTNLTSANLTGALPAIDGAALTGIVSVPTGSVIYSAANAAPTGFIKANGANISRTTYADLFAAIGTTYGAGDGSTTFLVPDLRGEFLRGWDDSRGIDTGRAFGTAQTDAFKSHTHGIQTYTQNIAGPEAGKVYNGGGSTVSFVVNTASTGGTETRPRNIALLACIKY